MTVAGEGGTTVELETRELPITIDSFGRDKRQILVVAREPLSGLTMWGLADDVAPGAVDRFLRYDGFPDHAALAVLKDRFVRFSIHGLQLAVAESRHRYDSIAAAQSEIAAGLKSRSGTANALQLSGAFIDLSSSFDRDYFMTPGVAFYPGPAIASLRVEGDRLLVTLTGQNGKTAVVTLDSDYRLLDVKKDQ